MFKKFLPTYHAKSIYDVDLNFFKKKNIKYILADLDNTLDGVNALTPSIKCSNLVNLYKENDLELIILSNNNETRVKKYVTPIKVKYLYHSNKPFKGKIKAYLDKNNLDIAKCIMIGDQVVTDIRCANRLKMQSILTDDLVKTNQFVTKFNKLWGNIIIKYFKKHHLLKEIKKEEVC